MCEGLSSGPTDDRFTNTILGVRGSGKTAVISEIEDWALSNGWIVLSIDGVDGSTDDLLGRLSDIIGQVSRRYQMSGLEDLSASKSKERTKGFKIGPYHQGWAEREFFDSSTGMGLRERLTILAEAAQRAGSGVLLTLDELHAANKEDARRLASDLQHITKRGRLPLAFVGAGLLEMKYTVMEGKKNTFLKRIRQYDLTPLTYADAIQGILSPIEATGGSITKAALQLAASSVDGSPYKMQLIGHTAWKAANAPMNAVDEYAVGLAIEAANDTMVRNISEPAYYDLSNDEQEYLVSLVALGDQGTTRAIAQMTGTSEREVRRVARRLDLAGYITRDQHGPAALTNLVPRDVVIKEGGLDTNGDGLEVTHSIGDGGRSTSSASARGSTVSSRRCRRWMPRAKAYCVLPQEHSGRCRSR